MIRPVGLLAIYGIIIINFLLCSGEINICGYNDNSIICCSGYKLDSLGDCTIPICVNYCGQGGQCIRPDICRCSNGQESSFCIDEDYYNNNNNLQNQYNENVYQYTCPNNCNGLGSCIQGKCQCNEGFTGDSCSEVVEGECYLNITRGVCRKLQRSLRMSMELCCGAFGVGWGDTCKRCEKTRCEKGFIEIDGVCNDINECQISSICQAGKCINQKGSYRCQCSQSYQFDPDQADCVQLKKKCDQYSNLCGSGMECVSLSMYDHYCKCLSGYVKSSDGRTCVQPSKLKFDLCAAYGTYLCTFGKCIADGYGYKCKCNSGYVPTSDGKACKKAIDFCGLYTNMLCPNGKCISLINDYICQCDPGYTVSMDRKKCTSVCDLYPRSLCLEGQCVPKENNNYDCRCYPGTAAIGKGKQCRRIMNDQSVGTSGSSNDDNKLTKDDTDFCSYSTYSSKCQGGQCQNLKNGYQCHCLSGYVSENNGQSCRKREMVRSNQMNDAATNVHLRSYCDKFGTVLCAKGRCIESGSSYQCKCNSGYQESADKKSCYDIDECSSNPSICVSGTCTNGPGSYQCSCYDGFTIYHVAGGPKCYDRDECEEDKTLCSNGRCINTYGSHKCECNSGYIADNRQQNCIPVQQTADISRNDENVCIKCSQPCKWVQNVNSYQCPCPEGLSPVLNTGLCAQLNQIVDLQFNMPKNVYARVKRDTSNKKYIYFELYNNVDLNNFRRQVTTQYRNVILDKCVGSSRVGRKPGVSCTYHTNS